MLLSVSLFKINMALLTCGLPVSFFYLLCVFTVGDGQFKGFRKLGHVQDTEQAAVFEEQWFIQKLDHFNGADTREWKQVSLFMLFYVNFY